MTIARGLAMSSSLCVVCSFNLILLCTVVRLTFPRSHSAQARVDDRKARSRANLTSVNLILDLQLHARLLSLSRLRIFHAIHASSNPLRASTCRSRGKACAYNLLLQLYSDLVACGPSLRTSVDRLPRISVRGLSVSSWPISLYCMIFACPSIVASPMRACILAAAVHSHSAF